MTKKQEIKLFEERKVRSVWDSETEEWYFAVVDVVEVLTDSADPSNYIKSYYVCSEKRKRHIENG